MTEGGAGNRFPVSLFVVSHGKEKQMSKNVYCPICRHKLFVHYGLSDLPVDCVCRKCQRLVTYNPQTDTTKHGKMPTQKTASGKRIF